MSGRKQFEPDVALDAAVRVFWRLGYSGASITDLLSATGLSRASLYATFGNKQQLFLSCLDRYVDTVGTASNEALHRNDADVMDAVLAGFDAIIDRMADPAQPAGCLLAQTAAEAHSLAQPIQTAVARIIDDQIEQMHGLLVSFAAQGTSDDGVMSLATYLVTVAQAIAVMHRAGIPITRLRDTSRHAMNALRVSALITTPVIERLPGSS